MEDDPIRVLGLLDSETIRVQDLVRRVHAAAAERRDRVDLESLDEMWDDELADDEEADDEA